MNILNNVPCHVFAPDWVKSFRKRYGSRPIHEQSWFFHVVTAGDRQPLRDLIEQQVDLLGPEERQEIIPPLRTEKQFQQSFNELAVGSSLRRPGLKVDYHPKFGRLTPDWIARWQDGKKAFVVEVLSSKPPLDRERCDAGWERLRRRLENIPGDYFIWIDPNFEAPNVGHDGIVQAPDQRRQKHIAQAVEKWLKSMPAKGAQFELDGIEFQALGRSPDLKHIDLSLSCVPFWVNPAPLRDAVEEKAKKYRRAVETARLPFVVCVVPDFSSGRRLDDLAGAVFGEVAHRIFRKSNGETFARPFRHHNGLFGKYPTLSAVSMANWIGDHVVHSVLENPDATYPLAEGAFPQRSTPNPEASCQSAVRGSPDVS